MKSRLSAQSVISLKRFKPIINTGFFLKYFSTKHSHLSTIYLSIMFPNPQLDHPYQPLLLTKTAMFNTLNRGRIKIHLPWEFSWSKLGRIGMVYGSDPEEEGERWAVGFVAGSHNHADHSRHD